MFIRLQRQRSVTPQTLLIVGGGTGGHLYPGIAVAEAWQQRVQGGHVVFVGSARGLEATVVPQHGYVFEAVPVRRLKNASATERLRSLAMMPDALRKGLRVVRRLRPDVVLGVGGYVSGPVVLAAALAGYPCAVAEQNALPGLTNRLLSRFVARVYTAFPEAAARLPATRVRQLGNPIRASLRRAAGLAAPPGAARHVLVMGGSQGARALNEALPGVIAEVRRRLPDVTVRHQTGRGNALGVRAAYAALGLHEVVVDEFIEDMAGALLAADLVVARAGATTVAELACMGRPAIFVPFPAAADDHQTVNAGSLVEVGAARMVPEHTLPGGALQRTLLELLSEPGRLADMGRRARERGRPAAADRIVDDLVALAQEAA